MGDVHEWTNLSQNFRLPIYNTVDGHQDLAQKEK